MSGPNPRDLVSGRPAGAADEVTKPVLEQHLSPVAGELLAQCSSCGDVFTVVVFRDGQFHHGRLSHKESGWFHRPCGQPVRLYGSVRTPHGNPQGRGPSAKTHFTLQHRWCCALNADSATNLKDPEARPGIFHQVHRMPAQHV